MTRIGRALESALLLKGEDALQVRTQAYRCAYDAVIKSRDPVLRRALAFCDYEFAIPAAFAGVQFRDLERLYDRTKGVIP